MIDLVTAAELCSRMKISKEKLAVLRADPSFPSPVEKLGPKLYFREVEIADWLSGQEGFTQHFTDMDRAFAFHDYLLGSPDGSGKGAYLERVVAPTEHVGTGAEYVVRWHGNGEAYATFRAHFREGK